MPAAWHRPAPYTRVDAEDDPDADRARDSERTERLVSADHARWTPAARRSRAHVERLLSREVGRRYARRAIERLSRRSLARRERQPDDLGGHNHRTLQAAGLRPPRDRAHGRRSESLHASVDGDAEADNRGRFRSARLRLSGE